MEGREMEKLALLLLGMISLIIIFLRIRRGIQGFIQDDVIDKCDSCGQCSASCCENKKEEMEVFRI
jgi:hypothetical protein